MYLYSQLPGFLLQSHGRPSLRSLVQEWNRTLQKEVDHIPATKMDAAAAFLAALEESKLTSLHDSSKKPPIEILPPGMASLYGHNPGHSGAKKPALALQSSQQKVGNQLLLEGPTETPQDASTSSEPGGLPSGESESAPPQNTAVEAPPIITSESVAESSASAPTSEQPDSMTSKSDAPPQSEPDAPAPAPAPLVAESSDANVLQLEDKATEDHEQASSTEPTETEGSAPPASTMIVQLPQMNQMSKEKKSMQARRSP